MTPDLQYLADPTRCPSCSATLPAQRDACTSCGLRLTGVLAGRLWQISVQAAELLETRRQIIEQLRHEPAAMPAHVPAATPAAPGATHASPPLPPPAPAAPRPEWSRRKTQNLLLALGVGLLAVAAIIFLAVSWDRLGVGGRSAVMAGVTGLAGFAAARAHRRGLGSTAEWLSLLTVLLAVLDCFGARSADLAGLGSTSPDAYWAGALAVVALLAGLLAAVLPTRSLRLAAAALGLLPVPLLSVYLSSGVDPELALFAVGMTAQTVAALALVAVWPFGARTRDARVVVAVGGGLSLVVSSMAAGGAAYAEDGSLVVGTALLLVLAVVVAVASTVLADRARYSRAVPVLDGAAVVLLVAALWAPVFVQVPDRWQPAVFAALGAALLAATLLVPAARRTAPAVVALAAALLPALAAAEPVYRAVQATLRPLHTPWAYSAADVAVVTDRPAVLELLVAGVALVLAAWVLRVRQLVAVAVPVLAAAATLTAPAFGAGYPLTLGIAVAVAAALLVAGALIDARGRLALGWSALGTGALLLALATAWSLTVDVATLLTLPAAALALLAGAVAARGAEALRAWRVGLVTSALLLGIAEAAALTRYGDAGWAAVWSLALGLLAVVAAAAAVGVALRTAVDDPFWAPLHSVAVAVAAGAVVADSAALARWYGDALAAGCGLAAACASGMLLFATAAPIDLRRPVRGVVQVVAAAAAVPALAFAALDGERLWVALLAVGIGVAVVATTPARHRLGWVAGLLLAASSWVRLALSDVDAPEAYTVPAGVALLVVGALRRRRDPACGSWQAYGSGLSLVLVPSLLRAVTDAGDLRPLLLALTALAVLAVGVARRLQAPLILGGLVLAMDALVQLAPYLVIAYDAAPRWVTIGLLGLALVGAGATYEQRVRDLQRVGRHVARLG
jgi:hypothetical protein